MEKNYGNIPKQLTFLNKKIYSFRTLFYYEKTMVLWKKDPKQKTMENLSVLRHTDAKLQSWKRCDENSMLTLQHYNKQGLPMNDLFKKDSTLTSTKDSKLGKEYLLCITNTNFQSRSRHKVP